MKFFYQVLIIILLIFTLSLTKTDIYSVYKKGNSYLEDKIQTIFNKSKDNIIYNNNYKKEVISLPDNINNSGALKVTEDFLTPRNKSTKLSQSGVIDIVNNYRVKERLEPLTENSKLSFSAEKKLQDMFVKQYFEHVSPEGVSVGDLADQVSYEYITIGENLALGNFRDDKDLVDAWMASPGHRANILNEHYNETGVAVASGLFEDKNVWIAVQHFGLSRDTCPKVDEILRGVINLNEDKINELESEITTRKKNIDSMAIYENLTTSEQIDKYNSIIINYNNLVEQLKKQIDIYNEQVRGFNSCITKNTTNVEVTE